MKKVWLLAFQLIKLEIPVDPHPLSNVSITYENYGCPLMPLGMQAQEEDEKSLSESSI